MSEPTGWPYRRILPIWVWVFLALIVAVVFWLQGVVDLGDTGYNNVYTILALLIGGIVVSAWFTLFSKFGRWVRLLSLTGLVAATVLFFVLFEFKSFSGAMVPQFGWKGGAAPAAVSLTPAAGGIDLRTTTGDDFPGYLGRNRDLTVSHVRLARDWEARPPELVWRKPVGAGWSGFAVVNGYAVTQEQREEAELVTAYDLMTGELVWSRTIAGPFAHPLGGIGPRSTPLIDAGRVYALSATGVLACLDGATGEPIWEKNLLEEYGVSGPEEFANIQYGRSNSPLVVGDLLVIPAGGNPGRPPVSLVAYDKGTGENVWEGGDRQISFSSPRLATLAGVEQILILNEDTASGHDPATGEVLWEHPWPGKTPADATASQAVPVPPDRVFVSKGYGGGAALFRLVPVGDGTFDTEELWHNRSVLRTKFTNVVIRDGYAYGLSHGILECVDLATGERAWKHGRYGQGQILGVSDTLLVITEHGEVVQIDPSPDRPDDVLGRFQAIDGQTWNTIALYGPYLAVRNAREAAVYRLPLRS